MFRFQHSKLAVLVACAVFAVGVQAKAPPDEVAKLGLTGTPLTPVGAERAGSKDGVLEAAIAALPLGGRLVANAVTLEMERVLLDAHARLDGRLIRLSVDRAEPVGPMTGWRAAMPVTQWAWVKA